jgi:hypothetical protein
MRLQLGRRRGSGTGPPHLGRCSILIPVPSRSQLPNQGSSMPERPRTLCCPSRMSMNIFCNLCICKSREGGRQGKGKSAREGRQGKARAEREERLGKTRASR